MKWNKIAYAAFENANYVYSSFIIWCMSSGEILCLPEELGFESDNVAHRKEVSTICFNGNNFNILFSFRNFGNLVKMIHDRIL